MILKLILSVMAVFLFLAPAPGNGADVNWPKSARSKVTLFYPGVTSWEFLTGDDHRLGGKEIKKGKKDCRHCHLSKEGDLDLKADEIVSGAIRMKRSHNPFEPEPMPGKKGVMTAWIQAAYDREFVYIRFEWDSKGTGWRKKHGDSGAPDRISIQLNRLDASFRKYGCFITCHNDLNTMPQSPSEKEVGADPYYGRLHRDDVRLYAWYARDSWSERKGEHELQQRLKEGGMIDMLSAEIEDAAVKPRDGWVFDDRGWEEKGGVEASGSWANGKNSIVFKRRLVSADPHDVSFNEGDTISIGVAIHEDRASKRKHYVSFPFSVGIGADGDVKALKLSE